MNETTIYISKENLLHNLNHLTTMAGHTVWPVLKSHAYGHGLTEVATILQDSSAEYFIVQNYFEAEQIWKTTKRPVLMLGTEPCDAYNTMDFSHLTVTVGSLTLLQHICSLRQNPTVRNIHIKINTGMNRQGFDPQEIPMLIKLLENNPHVSVTGILTHFSDADGPDNAFTTKQYGCFAACIDILKKAGINPQWIHAGNSAGLSKIPNNIVTAARSGIALYGLNPLEEQDDCYVEYENLKPVLEMRTHITHIRTIKPGEYVGYGNTHTADKETLVATIPVGYYEGIPRIMSNVGICCTSNSTPLPIIGRVSMNLITLDITGTELHIGDEIIVYSCDLNHPSSVAKNARQSGTISYELTTNLKPHIKRVIV